MTEDQPIYAQRESSLPFAEVKAASTMTIFPLALQSCDSKMAVLNFIIDDKQITAPLYEITNEKVLGYLPSRVWYDGGISLLYYISEALPDQARPFGDKPVYCFYIPIGTKPIEYDANWRVFIDQVKTDSGMLLVVMFNESEHKNIVNKVIEEN